jgi:hypothetical protein
MRLASPEEYAQAYTDYHHHSGYAKRARLLQYLPDPIIVVGCGFGYLILELQRLGKLAHGIDVSDYCWDHRVTDNFTQHDILRGLPRLNASTVITEDLLPWLTNAEAIICAENCAQLSPLVLHLVTESGQADYNYHSTGYWMSLTNQLTISLEGM